MIVCARGDLWLDEILSLQWGRNAKSLWDLIFLFRHDNNHPLNSAWLMLTGEAAHPVVQRLLSIVSGIASLLLVERLAAVISPRARAVPVALSGFSYALILYFSEARGYAPTIALVLFCAWLLLTGKTSGAGGMLLFWTGSLLAVLAHATAVYPLAALGVWDFVRAIARERSGRAAAAARTVLFFAPAAGFSLWFYAVFLREMLIAGGPESGVPAAIAELFSYGFGLPASGGAVWLALVAGGVYLAAGTVWGRYEHPSHRWLFVALILVFVIAALAAARAEYVALRYFLVFLPFFLLFSGPLWLALPGGNRLARRAGMASVALLCLAGNLPRLFELARWGRGGYSRALEFMVAESGGGAAVTGNHEMAVGLVMAYFQRREPALRALEYVPFREGEPVTAEWLVFASQGRRREGPLLDVSGQVYKLERVFPSAPVSGFSWAIYRRQRFGIGRL